MTDDRDAVDAELIDSAVRIVWAFAKARHDPPLERDLLLSLGILCGAARRGDDRRPLEDIVT